MPSLLMEKMFRFLAMAVMFFLVLASRAQNFSLPALQDHRVDAGHSLGPQLPCETEPFPAYSAPGDLPEVKSWSQSDLARTWTPPECTHWTETGFTTLVTTAARFSYTSDAAGLLRHIGAISERGGVRYWSTTHKRWQTLIVESHAVVDEQHGQRRGDFTADEMKEGQSLFFEQVDNLTGKATYRMRIVEASPERLVFDIENVSIMRYAFIPVLHPGEMQSIYFLDRESEKTWRFYGLMRTGRNANKRIAGNDASSINRAVAFYRFMVGIPTDQEPPAAR